MTTNGIRNLDNGENFWSNGFSAGLWSAASATVTFGIGDMFGATGSLLKEFGRAGAHSLASGTFSHLQGGNFWHGAASGGISSLGGSAMQAMKFSDPAMITGSAALGGLGSKIAGGDFWQGFATGMAVGAFNHAMHNAFNGPPRKILFDGKFIYIIENGKIIDKFPAVSGRPLDDGSFDYSSERQKIGSVGPIPEGDYSIDLNATQQWSKLSFIQKTAAIFDAGRFPGGTIAWGSERVDIVPLDRNPFDVRLRYGFTIHGGSNPGSAGCIDLTTHDRAFFSKIRNTGIWRLTVKY